MWKLQNPVFQYEHGTPQGDCSSLSEFTFCLAKLRKTSIANDTPSLEEHNTRQSNYTIVPQNYQMDIDKQYEDDISKLLTSISAIEKMKDELPVKLA